MPRPPIDPTTLPDTAEKFRAAVREHHLPLRAIAEQFCIGVPRVRAAPRAFDILCSPRPPAARSGQPRSVLDQHDAVYQKAAVRRNHHFALSQTRFEALATQSCSSCGSSPPERLAGAYSMGATGLMPPGLHLGNVRPCCDTWNPARRCLTVQVFIAWIVQATAHIQANALPQASAPFVPEVPEKARREHL